MAKYFKAIAYRSLRIVGIGLMVVLIAFFLGASALRLLMDKDHVNQKSVSQLARSAVPPSRGQYPILLHHGMVPVVTMHKFARAMRDRGYTAFSTQLTAANTIEMRARLLAASVDDILAVTKAEKINIIAHSMGGLDSRYLISTLGYGDRVATLTTIASPHRGSPLADFFADTALGKFLSVVLDIFAGAAIDGSSWWTVDTAACVRQLSHLYMQNHFNPANPDDSRVSYRSYAGVAGPPSPIPADPMLAWAKSLIEGEGEHDGVVPLSSARWGEFRGVIPAPHAVLIGRPQILGTWNYRAMDFFIELANTLEREGF